MKEERTDGLERRVVGQSTTERVLITLYEVVEKGCNIAHDSPAIGCWETYGCWERTHGPYRRRTDAERKAAEVQMAYDPIYQKFTMRIDQFDVDEKEIIFAPFYDGRKIL